MKEVYFTITGMNHYLGSDFLKKGMKVRLIKELTSLASNYEASQLKRQVVVQGRIKTMNEMYGKK